MQLHCFRRCVRQTIRLPYPNNSSKCYTMFGAYARRSCPVSWLHSRDLYQEDTATKAGSKTIVLGRAASSLVIIPRRVLPKGLFTKDRQHRPSHPSAHVHGDDLDSTTAVTCSCVSTLRCFQSRDYPVTYRCCYRRRRLHPVYFSTPS